MLKENKKKIIITGVVILLPILAGLLLWKQLPEQMATHFDSKGVANGWSSKAFAVFGLPVIILGCQVLCVFCTLNDPRRARACLKNAFCKMCVPLWGRFASNEGGVAGYAD